MRAGTLRAALLLALALAVPPAAAQLEAPWSSLRISGGAAESVTRIGMHTWWRPTMGGLVRVEAPFEAGFLEAGARRMPLDARSEQVPSYTALLVWAGWGAAWRPVGPVRLSAAARAGLLRMNFAEDIEFAGVRSESEIALGAAARLELIASSRFGLFAEVAGERVFTAVPMDQVHATAGMVLRLSTPAWLRRVLE